MNPFAFLEHHVHNRGVREIDHTVPGQESLPHPKDGFTVNDFRKPLEGVHVVSLHVVRLLFPCGERAEGVTFEYASYRIRGEHTERVIEGAAGTGGASDDKIPGGDVPALHKVGAKRNDELSGRRFTVQRAEHKVVFISKDVGS